MRLAACGLRLAAGGWRLAAGGWRLAAGGKIVLPISLMSSFFTLFLGFGTVAKWRRNGVRYYLNAPRDTIVFSV
ncbi:MAG: hypothetical protein LBU43_08085, partial [Candidatus Accumulibacter sp.]|nr:hypothetical protein [Accumulibacter sp.]